MCPTNHLASVSRTPLHEGAASSLVLRQGHFLIVDDISSMRRVIGSLLKDQLREVRISEAADGRSALQVIKTAETDGVPIDFVITDWNMPHMDGITLLRAIRELPLQRRLPVLLVTAQATREMILAAAYAGVDAYIVKPFNADTLKTKLDQIIAKYGRMLHGTPQLQVS